jgi:hypothetical protein
MVPPSATQVQTAAIPRAHTPGGLAAPCRVGIVTPPWSMRMVDGVFCATGPETICAFVSVRMAPRAVWVRPSFTSACHMHNFSTTCVCPCLHPTHPCTHPSTCKDGFSGNGFECTDSKPPTFSPKAALVVGEAAPGNSAAQVCLLQAKGRSLTAVQPLLARRSQRGRAGMVGTRQTPNLRAGHAGVIA